MRTNTKRGTAQEKHTSQTSLQKSPGRNREVARYGAYFRGSQEIGRGGDLEPRRIPLCPNERMHKRDAGFFSRASLRALIACCRSWMEEELRSFGLVISENLPVNFLVHPRHCGEATRIPQEKGSAGAPREGETSAAGVFARAARYHASHTGAGHRYRGEMRPVGSKD
jgi:hypothetical protein